MVKFGAGEIIHPLIHLPELFWRELVICLLTAAIEEHAAVYVYGKAITEAGKTTFPGEHEYNSPSRPSTPRNHHLPMEFCPFCHLPSDFRREELLSTALQDDLSDRRLDLCVGVKVCPFMHLSA